MISARTWKLQLHKCILACSAKRFDYTTSVAREPVYMITYRIGLKITILRNFHCFEVILIDATTEYSLIRVDMIRGQTGTNSFESINSYIPYNSVKPSKNLVKSRNQSNPQRFQGYTTETTSHQCAFLFILKVTETDHNVQATTYTINHAK